MKELPDSDDSLVVRTDFSDEAAWALICGEIEARAGELPPMIEDPDRNILD